MAQRVRITYATMSADNEELQADYDRGIETAKSWLGQKHPFYVNGEARDGDGYDEERSPVDRDILIGYFGTATKQDTRDAISAAKKFFPKWSGTPWQDRVQIMRRVADVISDHVYEFAALMAIEVGKSRLEALGDVEETADLIRYYCKQMEDNQGFDFQMGALSEKEHNRSVMRPYGVWAVISPFNFPMALAGGPVGGALVA
ncbi:MAG TPA: aldehyde dehydrogenase family protein, partial [Actinomycetota bacterium]|nr:aldehyde dehydrogenase family protein [Actinomycetota bacterium]